MTRRTRTVPMCTLALAAVLSLAACNRADRGGENRASSAEREQGPAANPATTSQMKLSASDREFLEEAIMGGMTEVELGKLAQERGASQAVKDLGQKLVSDHSAANERIRQIASDHSVTLPNDLDSKHQAIVGRFSKLSGATFDREFRKNAIDDHKTDIKKFEKESTSGDNPQVKQFATDTLSKLKDHLDQAEAIKVGRRSGEAARESR